MREIRERMLKVVIFTVKGCYRSSCNHPFIVGMLWFLVFVYRSYPFMFSLLVSASPVIACTAILLATLLSFGKPNLPEIEREERTTYGVVSLKTGVSENNVVLDRNESVSVERYGGEEKDVLDVVGQLVKETSSVANEICRAGSDGSVGRLLEKRSKEIEFDDEVQEERRREFVDVELESKSELFEERLGDSRIVKHHYSLIPDVDDEHDMENDRSPTGSVDSKVVNFDSLDSPPCTPWRHVNQEDEVDNEDDEALDSGSDGAESSSPDASMADILPVLDELHPLLDEDAPHPLDLSHDGSDAASEQSARSDESSNESDDDTEKEVLEVTEKDKGGNEEETHEEEDQTKSAITWTEEDERNLMDLGSSELERNQRLENLIARRRAQKAPSVAPETNLIDLESTDFISNVPPILTTRNNPFDLSQDSYKDMGLPPIPGSAPSVLLHRRNPFDIPYESSEEKPDLEEDSSQQEFTPFQFKEHFVRRHESFNAWRTPFRNNRPEKKDTNRFRPYFVAEPLGSEGTSYSHYQRQLSGISDSVASSVPDTGSIGSSEESERWNVSEEGTSAIEDRNNGDDDITRELDLISRTEQATELAGHGSDYSEEENSVELDQLGKRPEDTEYHHEAESSLVAEQRLANHFDISLTQTYSNVEGHEQRYRNISSSSSLSEESERIYVDKEVEEYPSFIDEIYQQEEPTISALPSLHGPHLNITAPLGDDSFHRDPVYDLTPLDVKESLSRSSIGSDLAPSVIKKSVSFSEIVTEIGSQELESDAIVGEEMLFGSSEIIQVDETQMESSSDVQIIKGHDRRNDTERIFGGDTEMTGNNEFLEDDKLSASVPTSGVPETEIISGGSMEIAAGATSLFSDHKEALESEFLVKSVQEASTEDRWSNDDILHIDNILSQVREVLTCPESLAVPPEVFGSRTVDELDEIKEFDEELLEELDTVGDFSVNEFREVDHHMESACEVSRVQHDAESSLTVIEESPTQVHVGEQVVHTEEHSAIIKEFGQHDDDMMHVSEFEIYRSPADPIDPLHYDGIGLDDSDLQSTEENTYSKAKETDTEVNSIEEISDIEENGTVMAETEAHFAKTFEAIIITAESTPSKTGIVHLDPPPSFVDSALEETITGGSESISTGKTHGQVKNHIQTQEFQDLDKDLDSDLNQPLDGNVEKVLISGSLLSAEGAKDIKGTFSESLVSEIQSFNDSDSALKQESKSPLSEALGFSEDGKVEDVQADLDFPRESKSGLEGSDVQKTMRNYNEEFDMVEAKSPESDDALISERKSLDDSFSALKQEPQSSPSEALKMSDNVRVNIHSPREAKPGADDYDEINNQQIFSEELYSAEAKIPKSHVLISERQSLDDSDLALKLESSSLSEALKSFEDGLADSVQADTNSQRETTLGVEESDVKETQRNSLGEVPKFVEVNPPECHDVTVSDVGTHVKDTNKKPSSSSSSSSSHSSSSDSDRE